MRRAAPNNRLIWGIIALAVLSILIGSLIGDSSGILHEFLGYEVIALAALIGLCVFPFIKGISSDHFDVFDPNYLQAGVFFVFYVVGTVIIITSTEYWVGRLNLRAELSQALSAAVTGMIGFQLGYVWGQFQFGKQREPGLRGPEPYDPDLIFSSALLALVVAVLLFLYWLSATQQSLGDLNSVFSDKKSYGIAGQLGSVSTLYFYKFQRSWPVLILLLWAFAPNRFWKLVTMGLWLLNATVYLAGGSRQNALSLFGTTLVLWYLQRKKRPSVFFLLVILVAFMWFSAFTVTARGRTFSGPVTSAKGVTTQLTDELSYRSTLNGLLVVTYVFDKYEPFVGFKIFEEIATTMVPRTLWPGKPTGSFLFDILDRHVPPDQSNAPGMLGIYYASFGLPGVFFAFFAFGALNFYFYFKLMRHPDDRIWQVFFAGWYFFYLVLTQRGSPTYFVMDFVYMLGPILAVLWLSGVRRHYMLASAKISPEPHSRA